MTVSVGHFAPLFFHNAWQILHKQKKLSPQGKLSPKVSDEGKGNISPHPPQAVPLPPKGEGKRKYASPPDGEGTEGDPFTGCKQRSRDCQATACPAYVPPIVLGRQFQNKNPSAEPMDFCLQSRLYRSVFTVKEEGKPVFPARRDRDPGAVFRFDPRGHRRAEVLQPVKGKRNVILAVQLPLPQLFSF